MSIDRKLEIYLNPNLTENPYFWNFIELNDDESDEWVSMGISGWGSSIEQSAKDAEKAFEEWEKAEEEREKESGI